MPSAGEGDVSEVLTAAESLATAAHRGQKDKAGHDYIEHPRRVAARLHDPRAQTVAWLHDVLEDTPARASDLHERGFPDDVIRAVVALTRADGQDPEDYYAAVVRDSLALQVKHADLDDNTDPARLALLDGPTRDRLTAKYAHARAQLDVPPARASDV